MDSNPRPSACPIGRERLATESSQDLPGPVDDADGLPDAGDRGGGRGQGVRRLRAHRGPQRRHKRVTAQSDQARGVALGGWGLAEAQATLVRNGLRHRIEVRTDGGLKTGRDVVIAALLGAETYGFGMVPLVAMGCAMARQCHINTCPTGIATQREDLRAKFKGTPDQVITYFTLLAEEVRQILAGMGFRSLDEVIGRNDLLQRIERPDVPRAQMLDLSMLLAAPTVEVPTRGGTPVLRRTVYGNDRPGVISLDAEILTDLEPYLEKRPAVLGQLPDLQPPPGRRRAGGGRHRPAPRRCRASHRLGAVTLHRQRRPELRRVHLPGPAPVSRGRCERLRRQGAERRGAHAPPFDGPLRGCVATTRDHRQHEPVRRDGRQAVRSRRGRRTVRGAQLRRGRRDRRRGQPLLRVHDWRHRSRAGPGGPQLRRGDARPAWPT